MTTIEKDKQYIANTYGRFPVTLVSGHGAVAVDENGKEYIDMGTGIGVNAFGYCDKEWVEAVTAQLNRYSLHSQELVDPLRGYLANLLGMITPGDLQYCFFTNGG